MCPGRGRANPPAGGRAGGGGGQGCRGVGGGALPLRPVAVRCMGRAVARPPREGPGAGVGLGLGHVAGGKAGMQAGGRALSAVGSPGRDPPLPPPLLGEARRHTGETGGTNPLCRTRESVSVANVSTSATQQRYRLTWTGCAGNGEKASPQVDFSKEALYLPSPEEPSQPNRRTVPCKKVTLAAVWPSFHLM